MFLELSKVYCTFINIDRALVNILSRKSDLVSVQYYTRLNWAVVSFGVFDMSEINRQRSVVKLHYKCLDLNSYTHETYF